MDLEEIKNIIELMEEHDLSCFNLETEEFKIKLKKGADLESLKEALSRAAAPILPVGPAPSPNTTAQTGKEDQEAEEIDKGPSITSPMVGTFYRAASPESEPYVHVGSRVEEDTVVCIIEAMKVMNEIQAETSGVITEVLISDTDPVQFGEPLFRVKPD